MNELARDHVTDLGDHHEQDRVLADIPVVGRQHVLRSLREHRIQRELLLSLRLCDVERDGPGARIQIHLVKVLVVIERRYDPAAERVIFKVVEDTVHLVEHALLINVFDPELIAVSLSDGPVLIRPLVPDMGMQVPYVVRLSLPDPEDLIHGALQSCPSQCERRELPAEIVAVRNTELLDRVGRSPVLPVRAYFLPSRVRPVIQNIPARFLENLIGKTHALFSSTLY